MVNASSRNSRWTQFCLNCLCKTIRFLLRTTLPVRIVFELAVLTELKNGLRAS
jgi:hypothetical protein